MTRYITVTSVIAPVRLEILERADNLTILGDKSCAVDENGYDTRPVDGAFNRMGAICFFWHDVLSDSESDAVADFILFFSPSPTEIRKETIADPHATPEGDCGEYFQNNDGNTFFMEGYLLISPDTDDIEDFFAIGRDIATE